MVRPRGDAKVTKVWEQRRHTITPGGWYASYPRPDREALWGWL
jgi:hypothetical protein